MYERGLRRQRHAQKRSSSDSDGAPRRVPLRFLLPAHAACTGGSDGAWNRVWGRVGAQKVARGGALVGACWCWCWCCCGVSAHVAAAACRARTHGSPGHNFSTAIAISEVLKPPRAPLARGFGAENMTSEPAAGRARRPRGPAVCHAGPCRRQAPLATTTRIPKDTLSSLRSIVPSTGRAVVPHGCQTRAAHT